MTRLPLLASFAAVMLATSATAATSPSDKLAGTGTDAVRTQRATAKADRELLMDLARSGHAETAASKLALEKSQNADVKALAQRIIDDHARSDARLRAIAAAKQVELPDAPSLAKKVKLKQLAAASGKDFDGNYVNHFGVVMHEETLEALRQRTKDTKDPDMKMLVAELLPVMESHLNAAHDLRSRIDPTAKHSKKP